MKRVGVVVLQQSAECLFPVIKRNKEVHEYEAAGAFLQQRCRGDPKSSMPIEPKMIETATELYSQYGSTEEQSRRHDREVIILLGGPMGRYQGKVLCRQWQCA